MLAGMTVLQNHGCIFPKVTPCPGIHCGLKIKDEASETMESAGQRLCVVLCCVVVLCCAVLCRG